MRLREATIRYEASGNEELAEIFRELHAEALEALQNALDLYRGQVPNTIDPYVMMAHAARKTTHIVVGDHTPEVRTDHGSEPRT